MKYVTLDYVVKNAMLPLEQNNMRGYQTLMQYAIRGFRELKLFSSQSAKIAYCEMLPNKSINLPSDYVKYVKIGICRGGRVLLLSVDNSICLGSKVDNCGNPLPVVLDQFDGLSTADAGLFGIGWPFLDHYRNGQWVGGLYGVGAGFNGLGYFREDFSTNTIQFSSEVPSQTIILEYISDGLNPDGTAAIPVQYLECLLAWIHWKRLEFKKGVSQSDIREQERKYIVQFNKLRHFNQMFTVQEYLDSMRNTVYQTPKR